MSVVKKEKFLEQVVVSLSRLILVHPIFSVQCDFLDENDASSAWHQCKSVHFGIKTSSEELDIQGIYQLHQDRQG